MTFELNGGAWLFLALWLAVILTLWNFYSTNKFTSRNKMIALSVVVSLLLFFIFFQFVAPEFRRSWEQTESIAIFPPLHQDASKNYRLEAQSLETADEVVRILGGRKFPKGNFLVPEEMYAPFHPDSIENLAYTKKLAVNFRYGVVSTIFPDEKNSMFNFSIYELNQGEPVLTGDFKFGKDSTKVAENFAQELSEFWRTELTKATDSKTNDKRTLEIRLERIKKDRKLALKKTTTWLAEDSTNANAIKHWLELNFDDPEFQAMAPKQRESLSGGALQRIARLSEQDTTNLGFARLAAEGFYWLEKFNDAAHYANRAYAIDPCNSDVLTTLAKLHFSRYRPLGFENETEIYQRALRCNPAAIKAAVGLASSYIQKNDSRAGQLFLEQYTQKFPANVALLSALGEIYVSRGMAQKMFETYESILEYDPSYVEAFYNLGVYYFNSEKFETATRFFEQAIEKGGHKNSLLYLARIAQKEERIDDAIVFLRRRIALKTGENDAYAESARQQLFEIMVSLGKIDSTGKLIEKQ